MADYKGLDSLLNTTSGMSTVRTGRDDDSTFTVAGADWFQFNGKSAGTIYVSSNSWWGFGDNSQQLKVYNRDGASYGIYRQDGTLWNEQYQFLKLRFDGYTQYNDTGGDKRLVYEVFLISDGRIMLNIITNPTNGSYLGTSQLVCGGQTVNIPLGANGPYTAVLTPSDVTGTGWTVSMEPLEVVQPYDRKWLIADGAGNIYTVADGVLSKTDATTLNKETFEKYGVDDAPSGSLLIGLNKPRLLYWHDSTDEIPAVRLKVKAVPLVPQVIVTADMPIKKAVESLTVSSDNNTVFQTSFDSGKTWKKAEDAKWVDAPEREGNTRHELEILDSNMWADAKEHIKFRYYLSENGYVRNIRADYKEEV